MNRAERILKMLEEEDGVAIKKIINNVVGKIKNIAKSYGIKIKTSLDDLEKRLELEVDGMPRDKVTKGDALKIIKNQEDLKEMASPEFFKIKYFDLLKDMVSVLNKMKKKRPWLDVESILRPFLKLEVEKKK